MTVMTWSKKTNHETIFGVVDGCFNWKIWKIGGKTSELFGHDQGSWICWRAWRALTKQRPFASFKKENPSKWQSLWPQLQIPSINVGHCNRSCNSQPTLKTTTAIARRLHKGYKLERVSTSSSPAVLSGASWIDRKRWRHVKEFIKSR